MHGQARLSEVGSVLMQAACLYQTQMNLGMFAEKFVLDGLHSHTNSTTLHVDGNRFLSKILVAKLYKRGDMKIVAYYVLSALLSGCLQCQLMQLMLLSGISHFMVAEVAVRLC